ncbi:MAG: ABC transporter ATP-binding protein [Sphingobacteriales bacterium]|nr:MAG: ABC transporter ATP-binding protein [Sphingobacteriales bacterium]
MAAISLQNLSAGYGEKVVLDALTLNIPAGQIIGYIGPNGAGKSTTVKILTGLLPDFSGEATVAGFDVRTQPMEVKKKIGYVPELAELYELLTPHEYLHFVGTLQGMDAAVAEDRMQKMLTAFGIGENLHQRMDTFSKGMRQKVLLTAGLLHNPEIVILDEPLSGLDANAVIVVKQLLQVLKAEGKTIFYCSHMMDVVEKVSDRIVLISNGRIVADGTIEELRQGSHASLEELFSRLTTSESANDQAAQIAGALQNTNPTAL